MIVYSGNLSNFNDDILKGNIVQRIEDGFKKQGYNHNNAGEIRAWSNSLMVMNNVLCNNSGIDPNVEVAIEYQIPFTSKRIDFLISGKNENDELNVVIIELKQWEECEATSRDDIVTTYVGGANRAQVHPSYQAYSYAKAIESFNDSVRQENVGLHPCAFLHNFKDEKINEIRNPKYNTAISLAPLFLKHDQEKLRDFIKKYIKKSDNKKALYLIENGKIKPSIALQDAIGSLLKGNKVFTMLDEQQVSYATVSKLLDNVLSSNEKHTIIIEGGPGTGKSVIAINLLASLTKKGFTCEYVTKNSAPRSVFIEELVNDNYKKRYVDNLFKGSGCFYDVKANTFDCLLVDEAHRLNKKSGLFNNIGENQIKEIINASKVSVFFIDEDQVVTTKDFGSIKEIERCANELGSIIHKGDDFKLVSQFRCNGSDGYINFLNNLLGIRETANYSLDDLDYDFRIFDDPNEMRDELRKLNQINNKSRMVAGYCYNWVSKKDSRQFDINLKNGFKAQRNFSNTSTRAIDSNSFEQVGCIHTSQGLEFDYVGVIIGKDLIFKNNKVETNYLERASTDASLKGIKSSKNYPLADRIIRNTYKTLLSRGQKGCFIYCEDKNLSNYIKQIIEKK